MEQIASMISNMGFPVVCCIIMFKLYKEQAQAHQDEINNLTKILVEIKDAVKYLSNRVLGADIEDVM